MKKILCLGLAFLLVCSTAFAMDFSGSFSGGKYVTTGTTDVGGIPVKIEILKNGEFDASKAIASGNLNDSYLIYKGVISGADGSFTFGDIPVAAHGTYIVNVVDFYGNTKNETFTNYDANDVQNAVIAFANDTSKNATKLEALAKMYYTGLKVDWRDSAGLSDTERTNAFANAFTEVNALTTITANDVTKLVNKNIGAYVVANSGKKEDVAKYADVLGITTQTYYAEYLSLTDAQKGTICASLTGVVKDASIVSNVNDMLKEKTIIEVLKGLPASSLGSKLDYYKNSFTYDLSNITDLSSTAQSKIYGDLETLLKNGTVTSLSILDTKLSELRELYKNVQDPSLVVDSRPSSSPSNGGSFVAKPTVVDVPKLPFGDLESVEWASEQIIALYNKGIVKGDENGNFNPNNTVTREEFVAMLVRALGFTASSNDSGFSDVPSDRWSSEAVIAARENGVVNGISATLFGAENEIKRCDMAVMAYNALKKLGVEMPAAQASDFNDELDIPEYAKEAVSVLSQMGIIKGDNGSFLPNNFTTRAEAAVIIYRILEVTSK